MLEKRARYPAPNLFVLVGSGRGRFENYGKVLQAKGELKPAEPLFVESLKTLRRLCGNLNKDHEQTLQALERLEKINNRR